MLKEKFKNKRLVKSKNQIYFMYFDSGNREYFSFGKDLNVMAQNILKRYNKYCVPNQEIKSIEEFIDIAIEEDFHFNTYIVEMDSASDMDYRDFDNEIYLGDYLDSKR